MTPLLAGAWCRLQRGAYNGALVTVGIADTARGFNILPAIKAGKAGPSASPITPSALPNSLVSGGRERLSNWCSLVGAGNNGCSHLQLFLERTEHWSRLISQTAYLISNGWEGGVRCCAILSIGLQPPVLAQYPFHSSPIPHSVVDSRLSLMPTGQSRQSAGRRRYMSWHSKLSRFQDRPNRSIAPIIDDVGTRQHMSSFFALCVPFGAIYPRDP